MSQNAKQIGQVLQRVAGIMTAVTVLATVIFTLLGVFGVVDMRAVQTEGPALAYVVAVGAFALSPLVAVGIVAVGLFNAIGIIAISAGGRASGLLIGIGEEARGMFTVAYSGRKAMAFGRWPRWSGNDATSD